MSRFLLWLLVFTLCLQASSVQAQVKNRGIPHIINYPKKTYNGGPQNWSITQDQRGFIYVGNNDGILEFDGRHWRRYALPDRFMYRSVAVGSNGTLYAGLSNEFGMMIPDETGSLTFRSLSARFPDIASGFNDIWKIYETGNGIYFQAKNRIFRLANDQLEAISPEKEFNFLFKANNTLYTWERHRGLVILKGNNITDAPGGKTFIGKSVETVIPYDETRVIIGTAKNGLFLYDGRTATPWAESLQDFFAENSVFCGTEINARYYAFGTIRNGVLILDRNGRAVQHINQAKGLQNNTVLSIFADRDNNLWLGLDQGISFIETNSPISYYSYGRSLPGTGYTSLITNGILYTGTNQGLFVKEWTDYEDPLSASDCFRLVPGTQGQVWSLRNLENTIFCGHNLGTFLVRGEQAQLISDIAGGWDYQKFGADGSRILGGTYTGLVLFERNQSTWSLAWPLGGFHESSRFFAPDPDGSIWVAHGDLGIFRVVPDSSLTRVTKVKMYNESDGLPSKYRNSLFRINGQILFTTINGVYRHNSRTDTFDPDPVFAGLLGKELIYSLADDRDGNIWYFKPGEIGLIHTRSGEAKSIEKRPFYPITGLVKGNFEHVNVIDYNNIIFSSEEGFVHYDPGFPMKYPESGQCYVRSLTGTGRGSQTFFGGIATPDPIRIPYAKNNLRIEFAAPFYENPEEIRFSYLLEGFDREQSEWSQESAKEYTGLREGSYTFHVKARNIYAIETQDATIRFRVLPPWHRSIVAFIFYALIILVIGWIGIRQIRKRLHKEKHALSRRHEEEIEEARRKFLADSLEAEKRLVMMEKEKFESELSHKNRQLASSVSGILRKNEFLIQIKEDISRLAQHEANTKLSEKLSRIIARLDENIEADNEDDQFEDHFDAVHDNFFKTLKKQFPQLTPKDLRLCAYLRMNLTTKEIAPLLNISPRGVEISRYRLRKKMNLPHDTNLTDFILTI